MKTFLPFSAGGGPSNEVFRRVTVGWGVVRGVCRRVSLNSAVLRCPTSTSTTTTTTSHIMGQVTHTGALSDRPVSQLDTKKLHFSIRARSRIMAVVAAMWASPCHPPKKKVKNSRNSKQMVRLIWIGSFYMIRPKDLLISLCYSSIGLLQTKLWWAEAHTESIKRRWED